MLGLSGISYSKPKGISIGEGVSIGPKVLLDGRKGLKIGRSVVIAYEAIIWTLNHDYNDVHFCGKGASVEIDDYAWICSRSMILPGIKIGKGAVVASGAIVTKDVPPYSIVAGIPAKVIGKRMEKAYDYGYNSKIVLNICIDYESEIIIFLVFITILLSTCVWSSLQLGISPWRSVNPILLSVIF